jgi:F0F1-type ATP synthase alpha subunit
MNKLDCSFNHLGIVEAIGDGIVSIKGLTNVANGDMIRFCISEKKQEEGLVLNLEKNKIVLSSDDVMFQLMSLPPIHTSAFIIGDYKTAIAGN